VPVSTPRKGVDLGCGIDDEQGWSMGACGRAKLLVLGDHLFHAEPSRADATESLSMYLCIVFFIELPAIVVEVIASSSVINVDNLFLDACLSPASHPPLSPPS
jgi:hypothetical protein